ncbi:MAG: hypothetical protein QXS27_03525 [Candidatus Jordarchaeaceae archaeon]
MNDDDEYWENDDEEEDDENDDEEEDDENEEGEEWESSKKWGKATLNDGTWIEFLRIKGSDCHIHLKDNENGCTVPVAAHINGETIDLRGMPIEQVDKIADRMEEYERNICEEKTKEDNDDHENSD